MCNVLTLALRKLWRTCHWLDPPKGATPHARPIETACGVTGSTSRGLDLREFVAWATTFEARSIPCTTVTSALSRPSSYVHFLARSALLGHVILVGDVLRRHRFRAGEFCGR